MGVKVSTTGSMKSATGTSVKKEIDKKRAIERTADHPKSVVA